MMAKAYSAKLLPLSNGSIDYAYFLDELLDATAKLEVYKEKIADSKLNSNWFMPTLQQKEALASSMLEGTQATLDGVLTNQAEPNDEDKNLNEVRNYFLASAEGIKILAREKFSNEFFCEMHSILMDGNVRKPQVIGAYRTEQNYLGKNDDSHTITYTPPAPEKVPKLMDNLISYINEPSDVLKPLVRTAVIHAQFETIHPFMDGNGRVGRMLIPLYLYYTKQIELPCFFISEALEHDKLRYYNLLNRIREKDDWNEWIKFFLDTVARQCRKYIDIITAMNKLYDAHIKTICSITKSSIAIDIINFLYQHPITTAKQIVEEAGLPLTSVNRFLNMLVENDILMTDGRKRNKKYIYYELLNIIR